MASDEVTTRIDEEPPAFDAFDTTLFVRGSCRSPLHAPHHKAGWLRSGFAGNESTSAMIF